MKEHPLKHVAVGDYVWRVDQYGRPDGIVQVERLTVARIIVTGGVYYHRGRIRYGSELYDGVGGYGSLDRIATADEVATELKRMKDRAAERETVRINQEKAEQKRQSLDGLFDDSVRVHQAVAGGYVVSFHGLTERQVRALARRETAAKQVKK